MGRLPLHATGLLIIIDTAGKGQERGAFLGQFNALGHAVVAHKFHDLPGKLLAFQAAIANAQLVHHVTQPHNAQANAAGAMRCLGDSRHDRDIGISRDHIIQEVGALVD